MGVYHFRPYPHPFIFTMQPFNESRINPDEHTRLFKKYILPHIKPDGILLDAGCGDCIDHPILFDKVKEIHSIDLYRPYLKLAQKHSKSVVRADLRSHIPHSNTSFDVIISLEVIEHLGVLGNYIFELHRVLKDDGILCIGDGRRDLGIGAKIIFNLAKLFISKTMSYYWKTSIMASYTPEEARTLLDGTDLKHRYEVKKDLFDLTITSKL